jgi:tetratricopeptide (TPR) repeat protein
MKQRLPHCRPRYLTLFWAGTLALACAAPTVFAATAKPKTSVADLRYGVALFHYYQQDYLSALTELMIADTRDGIQGHGDNPELIAGGISLAFGMENHAERLFYQLLQDETRPLAVRDAAWFYLGRLHYTRGNWDAAEQSFARVSDAIKPSLAAEMAALRINLQIRRDQLVPIPLKQLTPKQLREWNTFALYNMGGAFARHNDYEQARNYYRAAINTDLPPNPRTRREHLALRDKTYTAIGYSFLLEKNYTAAIKAFTYVRLSGPQAHQALLGYGWAAVEQERYVEALRPWQVLQQRSLLHPEVQEAFLALPFAYEKLGAEGEALAAYETAEQSLGAEIQRLKDMRATLTEGELLTLIGSPPQSDELLRKAPEDPTTLIAAVTDDGANWLKLDTTSIIKTRSAYLSELFAQNEFQTAVLDLRDLLRLRRIFSDWQPKLEIYADLLREKQALRERTEQQMAQQALRAQQARLSSELEQLTAGLESIQLNSDAMAFADDNARDLYRLVERAQTTLNRMRQAGEDTAEQQASLDLYRGILLWNAAQALPDRLWQAEKNRLIAHRALQDLSETSERIDLLTGANIDIAPMLARIAQLQSDTAAQLQQTDLLIGQRGSALRAQVDQHLNHQQQRLTAYLAQAHLAVARLYDTALRSQTP